MQDTKPDQAWFWSERWQNMERQVDADLAAGRKMIFDCVEDAIQALHAYSVAAKPGVDASGDNINPQKPIGQKRPKPKGKS